MSTVYHTKMIWPPHVRALILAFQPPWWIDVTYEDLAKLDMLDEMWYTMEEYCDDNFPAECFEDVPFDPL